MPTAVRQRLHPCHDAGHRTDTKVIVRLATPIVLNSSDEHWKWWSRQYVHLQVVLLARYGLIADPSCKPPTSLFRLPQVTRNGRFVRYPTWGSLESGPLLDLREIPAPSAADIESAKRLAIRYPGTWPKAVKELVASRPKHAKRPRKSQAPTPLSAEEPSALVAELAAELGKYDDGRHSLYLQLAGALCQLHVPNPEAIIQAVATEADDTQVERRVSDARSTVKRFESGGAIVGFDQLCEDFPAVAELLAMHVSVQSQAEVRVREELQHRPLPTPLDVELARARSITAALEAVERNQVAIVVAPTGVGKTAAAANIAWAVSSERKVALLCPSNVVAEELHAHLGSQMAKRRLGVLAARTQSNSPVCAHSTIAEALQSGGYSVRQELCTTCTHRPNCSARAELVGPRAARIEVSNHALVDKTLSELGTGGLLILDEMPALTESVVLGAGTADNIILSLAPGVLEPNYLTAVTPVARALADTLREGVQPGAPMDSLLAAIGARPQLGVEVMAACTAAGLRPGATPVESALRAFLWATGQHRVPPVTASTRRQLTRSGTSLAAQLSVVAPALSVLGDALGQAAGIRWADQWTKVETKDASSDTRPVLVGTRLNPRLRRALSHQGPLLVLDATPDTQVVEALCPRPVTVSSVDAHDGAPIRRIILATSKANRASMLPGGKPSPSAWSLVDKALAPVADAKVVLLVTYKPLTSRIDEQRTPWLEHFRTGGRKLLVAHYGHIRGQNKFGGVGWLDIDAVVTVGDPWPNRTQVGEVITLLDLKTEPNDREKYLAETELAQAHGRIRAARRTRGAILQHVGAVVPRGWNRSNTEVLPLAPGPAPAPSAMPLSELRNYIEATGVRALARKIQVHESTIRRYLRGRSITIETARRIRETCATA